MKRSGVLLVGSVAGLAGGGVAYLAGASGVAEVVWLLTTVAGLIPATWWVIEGLRQRRPAVDVIAVLALVGALVIGEYLAGSVIAVMLAGGRYLEARASRRARRELRSLLERAPRVAHRYVDGELTSPPLDEVRPGDRLLVKPGEVVPVDGLVDTGVAVVDESAVTGEPIPAERVAGDLVRSGTVNAGSPFDLRATTSAADSTYAGIVRLVEEAETSTAPFVRMADRYAVAFVPVTLLAAGAAWLVSGQIERAVAVLVVATPCPLILAAPVAIVSGLARAARRGVVIKGGGVLERLAQAEVLLFDKTGTLTAGHPAVVDVLPAGDFDAGGVLRLAASLDQVSPHLLAAAVVRAARAQGLELILPTDVVEVPGEGIRGDVGVRHVAVGKASWVSAAAPAAPWIRRARHRADIEGFITVFVAVDGQPAGALLFEDPIRTDAPRTIRALRQDGIRRIVMVTGDRGDVAEAVGAVIGVDEVLAERSPADKVEAVELERSRGTTIMVGDGVNDAPALAVADVGVAVATGGATASSEAADVVLMADRLDRVGEAVVVARRSKRIARQSALGGMALAAVAMAVAAVGLLTPALGALVQELIDVAAIGNALRAAAGKSTTGPRLTPEDAALARRLAAEHLALRGELGRIRVVGDALGSSASPSAIDDVRDVHEFLTTTLLPHERAEDTALYPVIARVIGGTDPTGAMSRGHVEISHLVRRLGRLLDNLDVDAPEEDVLEIRAVLYGLHAVLRLHFAQEDESYFSLLDELDSAGAGTMTTGQGA